MTPKLDIRILIIATNKYIEFVYPLIESIEKYFLTDHNVKPVVFTNMDKVNAFTLPVQHKPWPYMTLNRYFIFDMYKDYYKNSDYLFYLDADMLVVSNVGDEILGDGITATTHPYSDSRNISNTYESNKESTAFVEDTSKINPYFCGGFNGGRTKDFLDMSKTIRDNVIKDAENGIIARWHDETHLNKYLSEQRPSVILPRDYCTPESEYECTGKGKIIALDKNHKQYRDD